MDAMTTRSVTLDSLQAQRAVCVAIASFTVLCWDHIITFDDEVALIWCKPKGLLGCLFLLNRYITPLGFIVNIIGELSSYVICYSLLKYVVSVDPPHLVYREVCNFRSKMTVIQLLLSCRHFLRYQGAMVIIGVGIAQLIMLLRIYALYREHRLATAIPGLLFLVWVALEGYAMTRSEMVPITPQIHSCREVHDLPLTLSVTRAWMPLTYDSVVFAMTLWHALPIVLNKAAGRILLSLLTDGALYYTTENASWSHTKWHPDLGPRTPFEISVLNSTTPAQRRHRLFLSHSENP
ncbi:hypothetical protein P692DRAFT_201872753 [Suillus brevipes Sb2]|nr:hypothetical protein P692DRAFT_201872753 [Suillus brevipes Sb2]